MVAGSKVCVACSQNESKRTHSPAAIEDVVQNWVHLQKSYCYGEDDDCGSAQDRHWADAVGNWSTVDSYIRHGGDGEDRAGPDVLVCGFWDEESLHGVA